MNNTEKRKELEEIFNEKNSMFGFNVNEQKRNELISSFLEFKMKDYSYIDEINYKEKFKEIIDKIFELTKNSCKGDNQEVFNFWVDVVIYLMRQNEEENEILYNLFKSEDFKNFCKILRTDLNVLNAMKNTKILDYLANEEAMKIIRKNEESVKIASLAVEYIVGEKTFLSCINFWWSVVSNITCAKEMFSNWLCAQFKNEGLSHQPKTKEQKKEIEMWNEFSKMMDELKKRFMPSLKEKDEKTAKDNLSLCLKMIFQKMSMEFLGIMSSNKNAFLLLIEDEKFCFYLDEITKIIVDNSEEENQYKASVRN